MTIYVITTQPAAALEKIIPDLSEKTKLRTLLAGNFDGTIGATYSSDEYSDAHIVLECSETSAFAFMDWVYSNSSKTLKAVGLQFDNGWNIGAVALTQGQFTLMTTEDLSLLGNHETKQQMIADGQDIDPDEEYEFEWSDLRDQVQISFIHHMAQTGRAKGLEEIEPLKTLKDIGGGFSIDILEDAPSDIAAKLSQKIDYYNFELMTEIFAQQSDESWKDHRSRIRDLMEDLPEDLKSNKDLFKQIVQPVSSWMFEYAAEEVKLDKEVMIAGAKADVANNWGASVLEYCSEKLKSDREFIKDIIMINSDEFHNLSNEMKNDRELALMAADKVYSALSETLKKDEEIIITYAKTGKGQFFSNLPEDFKVTKKIVYAYLEGGGDLEDIPEEFINDKTLLLSLKHVKEDSDREYSLQKAIEKINKPISLQLASKILEIDYSLVAKFETNWLSSSNWNELFTNSQIIEALPFELGRNLILQLNKELESNNLIRPYRLKEMGKNQEKLFRDMIEIIAELLVKKGNFFSKKTEPYFEKALDDLMILWAPTDLLSFAAGRRAGEIEALNEWLGEDEKKDVEQDQEYIKLNKEAEKSNSVTLKGLQNLSVIYLSDLSEAGLIQLSPKENQ